MTLRLEIVQQNSLDFQFFATSLVAVFSSCSLGDSDVSFLGSFLELLLSLTERFYRDCYRRRLSFLRRCEGSWFRRFWPDVRFDECY